MKPCLYVFLLLFSVQVFSSPTIQSKHLSKQDVAVHKVLQNGLQIIVISNSKAQSSAVSLTVSVGQRDTPISHQGIPHLLEHVLFLGSKNYPKTTDWDDFIEASKGWSNGSTRSDNTRYHFNIDSSHLDEALVRFHDMLFQPVVSESSINIALSEVNEEFESSRNDDWQGILSVIKANTHSSNSAHLFGQGNIASLGNDIPKLLSLTRSFHKTYYLPNNMALSVYTNQPAEDILRKIEAIFNGTNVGIKHLPKYTPLHTKSMLGSIISISSEESEHSLDVRFEVPNMFAGQNIHTSNYIAHLLGHEAAGSIHHYLRSMGLAHNVSIAFQGDHLNEVLDIYITLTEKGVNNLDTVLRSVFGYINMLKDAEHHDYVQKELSLISERALNQPSEIDVGDWMSEISDTLLHKKSLDAISFHHTYKRVSKEQITNYLGHLTPEKMQAYLSSPLLPLGNLVSKHHNKSYSVKSLSKKKLEVLRSTSHDMFHLPLPNKYLSDACPKTKRAPLPANIIFDDRLNNEKALLVHITLPNTEKYTERYARSLIMAERIKNGIPEENYFIYLAGYDVSIDIYRNVVSLLFTGPSDRLTDYVLDVLVQLYSPLSMPEFDKLKSFAIRESESILYDKDHNKAMKASDHKLRGLKSTKDIPKAIEEVEKNSFFSFLKSSKESLRVFTHQNNKKLYQYFQHKALSKTYDMPQNNLPEGVIVTESNSATVLTLTSRGNHVKTEAMFRTLKELTSNRYFKLMRQDQQIAYVASVRLNKLYIPSLSFVVESSKVQTDELESLTKNFLNQQIKTRFGKMSKADFDKAKEMAISINDYSNSTTQELRAISYGYMLNHKHFDEEVKTAIKNLEMEELLEFLRKLTQ